MFGSNRVQIISSWLFLIIMFWASITEASISFCSTQHHSEAKKVWEGHVDGELHAHAHAHGPEKNRAQELVRLGSLPPNCEHKCRGCNPCIPVQVPTTTERRIIRPQYANYQPEGWKCKCGSTFYNP